MSEQPLHSQFITVQVPLQPNDASSDKTQSKNTYKHDDFKKKTIAGLDIASKELTLSPEFIQSSPRNVRDWLPSHAQGWLEEVFVGSENLSTYLANFKRLGVRGVDLLVAESEQLTEFGITDAVHTNRINASLAQLMKYQQKVDKEVEEDIQEKLAAQPYFDLLASYEKFIADTPVYPLPDRMELWKPLDVFAFLKLPENVETLSMFLKPLALKRINGEELIKLIEDKSGLETLQNLEADERDKARFREAVKKHKYRLDEVQRRLKEDRNRERLKGLRNFDRSRLIIRHQVGKGSFGFVYLAEYEKRKVILKQLDIDVAKANADREYKRKKSAEMMQEAFMLQKAAGAGVVQLIGVAMASEQPGILLEFMCKFALQLELETADKSDDESIFHPGNHRNRIEAENGVANPVLLQMIRIARDVASAIARIHAKGIIHLDIAARNILLDASKRPKLGDFGCAAMESEMLDQHKLRKQKIDEWWHSKGEVFETQYEIEMERMGLQRAYTTFVHPRPKRWMPEWVVNAGSPSNPRIDRHTDIYSFGCVMYEMCTRQVPHSRLSEEEVEQLKLSGQGNPSLPADLDPRYAEIMRQCWEEYDRQPTMESVYKQLSQLHSDYATESIQLDVTYTELRDLKTAAFGEGDTLYSTLDSGASTYSTISDVSNHVSKMSTTTPADKASTPRAQNFPPLAEGRIRLRFPESVNTNDAEKLLEYEETGIAKEKLEAALLCAYRYRDHSTISCYMECIYLDNHNSQIGIVMKCFDYLRDLSMDEHGSTDEEDTWQNLCASILRVIHAAAAKNLQDFYEGQIMRHSLSTLAALLHRKSAIDIDFQSSSTSFNLENDLCQVVFSAFRKFGDDARLVENAASAVVSLSHLAPSMLKSLYNGHILDFLLQSIKKHAKDDDTVIECSRAVGCFPLQNLLDPRPANTLSPGSSATPMTSLAKDGYRWGEVLDCLFSIIDYHMQHSMEESQLKEQIIEACLFTLFRTCESGIFDPDLIEKFLYFASASMIETLMNVLRAYPDHFRIQEGAIGLLSHIVNTGSKVFVDDHLDAKKNSTAEFIDLICPAEDRIATLLQQDSPLNLFLSAMAKFKLDNKVAIGIRDKQGDRTHQNSISRGVYRTMSRTVSAGPAYNNNNTYANSNSTSPRSNTGTVTVNFSELRKEFEEGIMEALQVDEQGEHISAASLQKCVALILATACNSSKKVQQDLVRSRYNELILGAFKNFPKDIQLISLGCHAIFSTCRQNAMHQRMLLELEILQHLNFSLECHTNMWEVADGVVCVLIGLLDPPPEIQEADVECRKVCDGFKVVNTITSAPDENSRSLIVKLALLVAEFQMNPDTHPLVCNFLKLIGSVAFWNPSYLSTWQVTFINLNENERYIRQFILNAAKQAGRLIGEAARKQFERSDSAAPAANMERKISIDKRASNSSENQQQQGEEYEKNSNPFHPDNIDESDEKLAIVGGIITEVNNTGWSLSLNQFTLLLMQKHADKAHVLVAGLAVIAADLRRSIGSSAAFGAELNYAKSTALYKCRENLINQGLVHLCLIASFEQEDHPVLIRYSLWLLLIFISERSTKIELTTKSGETSGSSIAAKIAINHGIEWAIIVCKKYENYYSLQSAAILFLIWMERHGRFSNRSETVLRDLRSTLEKTISRGAHSYLPLQDEGHDVFLMGQDINMFGKLAMHADRLIRLVDSHLPQLEDEVVQLWDGVCRPVAIRVSATETAEDPVTFAPMNVYVVDVIWEPAVTDEEKSSNEAENVGKKWRITCRFRPFFDLMKDMLEEFDHLPPIMTTMLSRKSMRNKFVQTIKMDDHEFLENRRLDIQRCFDEMTRCRATLFHPRLLSFLQVPENTRNTYSHPHPLNHISVSELFDVNCMHYDVYRRILLVGSGVRRNSMLASKKNSRGTLSVYVLSSYDEELLGEVAWSAGSNRLVRTCLQDYNVGVCSLGWDSSRRWAFVGLTTGPIVFYFLTADYRLEYCGELDYHRDIICDIFIEPSRDLFLSAAVTGTFTVFDLKEGAIVSQSAGKVNAKLLSVTYDSVDHVAFCGTNTGSVFVYDLSVNPPEIIHKIVLQHPAAKLMNKGDVMSVQFEEDMRLLYAIHENLVHIYRIGSKELMDKSTEYATLTLSENTKLCSMLVLQRGRFVVAAEVTGKVAVFDLRDQADATALNTSASPRSRGASKSTASMVALTSSLSTTASKLVSWQEIVKQSDAEIRDWLRAQEVDFTQARNRSDLMQLVAKISKVRPRAVADILIPSHPRKDVLFVWNMQATVHHITYVEDLESISFACHDGNIRLVSLSDFLCTFSGADKRFVTQMRTQLAQESLDVSGVKGSKKSTRGARHQL